MYVRDKVGEDTACEQSHDAWMRGMGMGWGTHDAAATMQVEMLGQTVRLMCMYVTAHTTLEQTDYVDLNLRRILAFVPASKLGLAVLLGHTCCCACWLIGR